MKTDKKNNNKVISCFTLSNKAKGALLVLLAEELRTDNPLIKSQSAWIENAILQAHSKLISRDK